jgi:glutaminyl-tRNA synthetase
MNHIEISNFIKNKIKEDLLNGKVKNNKVIVRFPPEPNGYLHLGHVKSIILNSSLAKEFNGELNLRFDDTNPEKENEEYVNAIKNDVNWITDNVTRIVWASDYFDIIYECAVLLISNGLAYVDDNDFETIKALRGDYKHLGIDSNYRNRSIAENLELFSNMKNGLYKNGEKVLRAKIDMHHSNINMRDPILYRIKHAEHHNTGNKWCIYPMYDFAHPLSDGIEGITHSICTMEFEDHRPLYDWTVESCHELLLSHPVQIEFARLEMEGVLLSKRKLNELVVNENVTGWADPVMPTISGLRNRGLTPEILNNFITKCGISKANSLISKHSLEESIRDILSPISPRTMTILEPIELFIDNLLEVEKINISIHPKLTEMGDRIVTLTDTIYVEKEDIRLTAEKDFWRIYPGNTVRLKNAYNILIKDIIVDNNDNIIKVIASIDYNSKNPKLATIKSKVALHWISSEDSHELPVIFYNELVDNNGNYSLNSVVTKISKAHHSIFNNSPMHYEFERCGYFYVINNIAHCLTLLKK